MKTVLGVLAALIVAIVLLSLFRARNRFRAISAIRNPSRVARGAPMVLICEGPRLWPFIAAGTTRGAADLAFGEGRFLLACGDGLLIDRQGDRGPRLISARCPGPGKLVLEGELLAVGAPRGSWRMDLSLADAEGWARELEPMVTPGERVYTSL